MSKSKVKNLDVGDESFLKNLRKDSPETRRMARIVSDMVYTITCQKHADAFDEVFSAMSEDMINALAKYSQYTTVRVVALFYTPTELLKDVIKNGDNISTDFVMEMFQYITDLGIEDDENDVWCEKLIEDEENTEIEIVRAFSLYCPFKKVKKYAKGLLKKMKKKEHPSND